MSNKIITLGATEHILTHIAQPTVNGTKCNHYEIRTEVAGQAAYHQHADIYVPLGRNIAEHLEWALDRADRRSFPEWSKARFSGAYAA